MNKVYKGGFAVEFSVSMLKETITLIRSYIHETRKQKNKIIGKIYANLKYEIFIQ